MNKADVMNMSPNDYVRMIEKKVEEVTENIRVVGKQNTRLKKKCDRYEKKLSALYLNGNFK